MSTAQTLLPLIIEQQFGREWLRRWRLVADPAVQWLALGLAAELRTGRHASPAAAAEALVARGWTRRSLPLVAGQDLGTLLGAVRAAGLWPAEG